MSGLSPFAAQIEEALRDLIVAAVAEAQRPLVTEIQRLRDFLEPSPTDGQVAEDAPADRTPSADVETRQGRTCSTCKRPGHNSRTCPGAPGTGITPVAAPPGQPAIESREALVQSGMEMATKIASRHARRSSTRDGIADDIRSAALEGLVKAARDFDPTRGAPFLGYAHHRITGAVLDFLRAQDHMSRDYRDKAKKGEIEPAPAPVSLDCLMADVGFGDRAPDPNAVDSLDEAERGQVVDILESAAVQLPARLRTVLRLRYADDRTLGEIGAELGVTESRGCQLLHEAHAALRTIIAKQSGAPGAP